MKFIGTMILPFVGMMAIACSPKQQQGQQPQQAEQAAEFEARVPEANQPEQAAQAPATAQQGAQNPMAGERGEAMHTARFAADKGLCPIDVPGARAQVRTSNGNVVLVVTTTDTTQLNELRRRARDFAARTVHFTPNQFPAGQSGMYGQIGQTGQYGQPGKMEQTGQAGEGTPGAMTEGVPVRISVQDVSDGVLIVITPSETSRLNELQALVQKDAELLGQGRCPIGQGRTSMNR